MNLTLAPLGSQKVPGVPTKGRLMDSIGFDVAELEDVRRQDCGQRCRRSMCRTGAIAELGLMSATLTDPWGATIRLTEGLDKIAGVTPYTLHRRITSSCGRSSDAEASRWFAPLVLPIGGCAVATLITWKLWPFIQPSASPLFFLAVMISALYGGVVAGLIATCCRPSTTAYLFMTPQFSMAIDHSDIFRLVVFAAVALLTSWIAVPAKSHRRAAATARRPSCGRRTRASGRSATCCRSAPTAGACESGKPLRMENRGDATWPRHAGAPVEPRALPRVFSAALSGISRADRLSRAPFQLLDLQFRSSALARAQPSRRTLQMLLGSTMKIATIPAHVTLPGLMGNRISAPRRVVEVSGEGAG